MGLLKHFVLPVFAIIHALAIIQVYGQGKLAVKDTVTSVTGLSAGSAMDDFCLHMVGDMGSTSVVLMVNCVAAIALENAHYRGMACLLETLFFGINGFDLYFLGADAMFDVVLTSMGIIGLLVHANEPGILTRDKNKKKNT